VQADEFYDPATLIDKGHLVRRDDNCWAENADSLGIEYGNSDTFHWTNCTPQHELFNRDMMGVKGLWGILENEIKKQLNDPKNLQKDFGQRACVLAGPVLDNKNDPEYNDIQYPLLFWKIFALVSESDGPLVYGFLLSQQDKVEEFGLEKEARPRFNVKVKAMQRPLKEIEKLSGVIFDETLHQFDVLNGEPPAPESLDHETMKNFVRGKKKIKA
jgi:endonuclease G